MSDFNLFPTAGQLMAPKARRSPKKGGAKAQDNGKKAENVIERTCEIYEHEGRGFFFETSAKFRVEKRLPQGKAVGWLSRGPVDRVGVGDLSGKPYGMAFDVKSTDSKTSFPLSNIEGHQVKSLERYSKGGGIAFVLIHFTALDRWFVLTMPDLRAYWGPYREEDAAARASIPLNHLASLGECPKRGNFVDFLTALERFTVL